MKAVIVQDRDKWNSFIARSEYCNITQTYEWGELLPVQRQNVLPIGVLDNEGELCAAMLVFVTHIKIINGIYFYAPRGPVIDNPDSLALDVLLDFVYREAKRRNAFMLKVEPGVPDGDEQWLTALSRRAFRPNAIARHLRHEWVLDLRPDEEKIFAGMRQKWRYNIRLALRKQVVIREGKTLADINIFYRLLKLTSERDSFVIYGRDFYERCMRLYGSRARLFIAEYKGIPLGAVLLVVHGLWCWYMYGASGNEHREYMPNHLLQWTAMRWAKAQGCQYYNFRGIPDKLEPGQPMWGVYQFKSGFGGYAMRSLATHDLVYKPVIYRIYGDLLKLRQWYVEQMQGRTHITKFEPEVGKIATPSQIDALVKRGDDTFEGSTYRMRKDMH